MRRAGARLAWIVCATLLACAAPPPSPAPDGETPFLLPQISGRAERPVRLLLVSVAGLTPDRYGPARGVAPDMPVLAALARAGVAAESLETVAPAATYPAHATLVTGRLPAAHGIVADRQLGARGVRATPFWHASHLRVPTLWQVATEAGLRVAAVGWPSTVGASVAQLLPDLLPTRREQTWLALIRDAATPELVEIAERLGGEAPGAGEPGAARDGLLVGVACELLGSAPGPDLLLLHLSQTAVALRAHGADSQAAREAFAGVDAALAQLLRCSNGGIPLGVSAVAVTGDHGFVPVHTVVSPNAELGRAGLLGREPAASGTTSWSAIARSNGGSAFVYADSDRSALRARRMLEAQAETSRAYRVVSAEEMLRAGADPKAWFGLEAEPGFAFGDSAQPPLLRPSPDRVAAGYLPARSGMSAGFVAWGRGIRARVRVPVLRQTDIGPTLAWLLGLRLPEAEGRVLVGLLDVPVGAER